MKKIKLPLEMANGVMVRSLDELKENWDLEKVVEHFVTGKLTTWLNDRYYTDLAEKVENLSKDGDSRKLQQALCRVFEVPCEELELDVDEIAERKRRQDLLRQYTSDDEILKNVDKVAFNQEDLADLLDDEIAEIYLFNNKFTIPLNVEGKKYIGIGDNAVAEIRSKKPVNFVERGITFSNVKFDEKYAAIHEVVPEKPKFSAKIGDIIKFGKYEGEKIEWQVLDVKDGRALILSKYGLDDKSYNEVDSSVTWEKCSLRKWLNNVFFNLAFDETEQKKIVLSRVVTDGNDTEDKVFLLSVSEIKRYFQNDEARICYTTTHLGNIVGMVMPAWWWLRSQSCYCENNIATIHSDGSLFDFGMNVTGGIGKGFIMLVRPAMWVDLSKM